MITLTPNAVGTGSALGTSWSCDPDAGRFVLASSRWRQGLAVDRLATCRIWNHMEIRIEDHPVQIAAVREMQGGQAIDCRVSIPFVGSVIRFTLHVLLDEALNQLTVTLPRESLCELEPDAATLLSIDVLPGFGAAPAGQTGYLFLPCFAGVLHRFAHDVSREKRLTIYAQQPQWADKSYFNLWGMQTAGHAWCAMVTQGDTDSQLVVRSHYEADKSYSVHASWVYRWDHADAMIDGNRQITMHLLEPDEQNYNQFACCYRQWLRESRGLKTLAQKVEHRPAMGTFSRSFLLKIMMGYKKADLNGQGAYQSNTTFDQARLILEQMHDDGIDHITTQLVGWNAQGHDGRYPQRFPVNEAAGGEEALRSLIHWGKARNIHIGVHDNYSDSYACGDDFDLANVIVGRDGKHWRNVPWAGGFNWRLCPLKSVDHARRDMPRIAELGVKANYYMDAIGALSTCHSKDHPADRCQIMQAYRSLFELAQQEFETVSTEIPFGPYLDLMDGVYMPHCVESSRKWTDFVDQFVDEHVPALAIVLHNGIRYHLSHELALQGRKGALMDCIWGAMPFVEIAYEHVPGAHGMPKYEQVRDYVLASWELCCGQLADRAYVDIESINQVSESVWHTRYADGIVVQTDLSTGVVTVL